MTIPAFHPTALLIVLTGADRAGLTAEIAGLLARKSVQLLDVEQVVVQGNLTLNLLADAAETHPATAELQEELRKLAADLDVQIAFRFVDRQKRAALPDRHSWAVTLLAPQVSAEMLAIAAGYAAARGFTIDNIHRLSDASLLSIELILSAEGNAGDDAGLKCDLLQMQALLGCDVALQREGLMRRSKRLVVMDMDSTLIQQEVIDELARKYGVFDKVAAITHRAMNGELHFDDALRERVMLLKGAPASILTEVQDVIHLTPGAESLIRVLKRLGYRLAVISGGFIEVAEPIRARLGLDYAFANELEIVNGKLTGRVLGAIVNRQRKAELLEQIAATERIALEQVIAIGDGANDLDMLNRAGLGIAFNAKQVVREQAKYVVNQRNLDAILYLLGIRDAEANAI